MPLHRGFSRALSMFFTCPALLRLRGRQTPALNSVFPQALLRLFPPQVACLLLLPPAHRLVQRLHLQPPQFPALLCLGLPQVACLLFLPPAHRLEVHPPIYLGPHLDRVSDQKHALKVLKMFQWACHPQQTCHLLASSSVGRVSFILGVCRSPDADLLSNLAQQSTDSMRGSSSLRLIRRFAIPHAEWNDNKYAHKTYSCDEIM